MSQVLITGDNKVCFASVRTFQDALKDQDLPTNLRTLIDRQFRQVKLVHDRVKQMRDAQSAVSGR